MTHPAYARLRQAPCFDLKLLSDGFCIRWGRVELQFAWGFEVTGDITADQDPKHAALWGPGQRSLIPVRWLEGMAGTLSISTYPGFPGLVISGELAAGPEGNEIDLLSLFSWTVDPREATAWRWLVNSGHQGYSGSVCLGSRLQELPFSQDVTVLARPGAGLALGNVSFARANILFERRQADNGDICISACLAYGGMELPAGGRLALESLLILPGESPLAILESWADAVAANLRPRFHLSRLGLYNQWYANWTPDSSHGTAELNLQGAEMLRASPLYPYGIAALGSGVWHNRAAFGEEEPWPGHFPKGVAALCEQVCRMGVGFMHGGFWGKASECSTVFQSHPEWMAQDEAGRPAKAAEESWGACPSPYYIPDVTRPEVQAWVRQQWEEIRLASTGLYWLDFYGAGTGINLELERPARLRFSDREVSFPFEIDRLLTRIIRDVVGPEGVIGVYTSPTFNLIGLIDRARIALDCGAIDPPGSAGKVEAGAGNQMLVRSAEKRWGHVMAVARNLAAGYFCHNRFWINDPDPAMVGLIDRPETLEEARLRVMLAANSGGFITVGEAIDQIPPRRLDLLRMILPPYGQAARPLDLMAADVPEVYDLFVQTSWDSWHVVTLVNWESQPRRCHVGFEQLGLGGAQLVFEMWEQVFCGEFDTGFEASLPPRCCRVFCVRPRRPYPWLLGSNLHVSQGGVEINSLAWDAASLSLHGSALRPDGEGSLYLYVPPSFRISEVSLDGVAMPAGPHPHPIFEIPLSFTHPFIEWEARFSQVQDG